MDIREHVRNYYHSLYTRSGLQTGKGLPILTGKELAWALGYPVNSLDDVPGSLWSHFFPCGYPLKLVRPKAHDRILNLGSGAGIDSITMLLTQAKPLRIVNLDIVAHILREAAQAFSHMVVTRDSHPPITPDSHLYWTCGDGERLPFADGTFHWILVNGVLNLFSRKEVLLREILRVLRPGGKLVGADLCCGSPIPGYFADELDAWAWCMSGACTEIALRDTFLRCGFRAVNFNREEELDMFYRVLFTCIKPLPT